MITAGNLGPCQLLEKIIVIHLYIKCMIILLKKLVLSLLMFDLFPLSCLEF